MANFSCYITIKNSSSVFLTNVQTGSSYGEYKSRPTTNLEPGESTSFQLADNTGPAGSTGWTKYDAGEGVVQVNYDCAYDGQNVLSVDIGGAPLIYELYGNNDAGYTKEPKGKEGQYPSDGHPLSGLFIFEDA